MDQDERSQSEPIAETAEWTPEQRLHADIAGLQSIINGYRIECENSPIAYSEAIIAEIEMIELKIKEIMEKLKTM